MQEEYQTRCSMKSGGDISKLRISIRGTAVVPLAIFFKQLPDAVCPQEASEARHRPIWVELISAPAVCGICRTSDTVNHKKLICTSCFSLVRQGSSSRSDFEALSGPHRRSHLTSTHCSKVQTCSVRASGLFHGLSTLHFV
jgi:hypothetical protein